MTALRCAAWRHLGRLVLAVPVLVAAASAAAVEDSREPGSHIRALLPKAQMVGAGHYTWFGFQVYGAALFADNARYVEGAPFALELTYARDFKGAAIADRSIDEIRKLGMGDEAELEKWLRVLTGLIPDVRRGDTLTGVAANGRPAHFFHNGKPLGAIADERLRQAFFAIWLDPRTSAPGLRSRLIGSMPPSR
jgi:hypothetical protein